MIPKVSVIPSKNEASTARRSLLSSVANAPSSFSTTCDYNLLLPTYLVADRSTEVVTTINLISCMSDQLRIRDVGLNKTFNPNNLPYAAVVDVTKCSADQQEIQTWYVYPISYPEGFGDGIYESSIIFQGFGSEIHITLSNTVQGGYLKRSTFSFSAVDESQGGILIIDNTVPNITDVTFLQQMSSSTQYLHTRFNPLSFVGSATIKNPDNTRYDLDFDYEAINRRTNASGVLSSACIDYSIDKMIIVGNHYDLFNADDGSKFNVQTGFAVNANIQLNAVNASIQLWVSYYGLYANSVKVNQSYIDSSTVLSHVTSGMTVTRMDYQSHVTKSYTLKKQSARLNKVIRRSFSLQQVKGLTLKIQNSGKYQGVNILWNGTNLVEVGKTEIKCLRVNDYNSKPSPVDTTFTPNEWYDCGCLSSGPEPLSRRISGPFEGQSQNSNPPYYQNGQIVTVTSESVFTVSSIDFPNGIQVSNSDGNMNGNINLKYTPLEIIKGMNLGIYNVGDVVTQVIDEFTNATGTIYKPTNTFIYGLTCNEVVFTGFIDSSNFLHVDEILTANASVGRGMSFKYNGQYWGSIGNEVGLNVFQVYGGSGPSSSVEFTSSYCFSYKSMDYSALSEDNFCNGVTEYSSSIPVGIVLTQGINIARSTTNLYSGQQDGLGYEMISGSSFDTSTDIVISSDGYGNSNNYRNIVGTISFSKGLETDWSASGQPVTFVLKEAGSTSGCVNEYVLANLPFTDGNITIYGSNYGLWGTNVNPGSSCSISTADYAYDISLSLPNCDYLITYRCKARIENKSTQIIVELPSQNAIKFEHGRPVFINGQLSAMNVWIEQSVGDVLPVESSTILAYQTQSLVADNDVVPTSLLCYDNCPLPTQSLPTATIATRSYPSIVSQNVQVKITGSCSQIPGDNEISFSGFVIPPALNFTWGTKDTNIYDPVSGNITVVTSYSLDSVLLTDPGVGCLVVTGTFNATGCSTMPEITLTCNTNGDYKDYRNAYHYHFDPISGLLIDDLTGFTVEIADDGDQQYFGNFFEATNTNKELLLCDWNKNQVCSWKSWQFLDVYYTYESGPQSSKITLFDQDDPSKIERFQEPLNLIASISADSVSASGQNYDGTTFLLTYQDDLQGLPQVCLNSNYSPSQCDYDSLKYSDMTLSPLQVLVDFNGNKYYAKAAIMNEYFPLAQDQNICSLLTFNDLPEEPNNSIIVLPANMATPFPSGVLNTYLNGGIPVVVAGVAIYELSS